MSRSDASTAGPDPSLLPDLPDLPDRIVVGLDGSEFGDRALPVARDLAAAIGAELTLLSIVEYAVDFEPRASYLAQRQRQYDAHMELLLEANARQALARRLPGELLCLATRGRSAVIRSLLGSVAFAEVATGRPTVLVGTRCTVGNDGGPVLLPVGGDVDYGESAAIAAAWAAKLGVGVVVVTVRPDSPGRAGSSGPGSRGRTGSRGRADPAATGAVAALGALGTTATATVVEGGDDPIRSLAHWCRTQPSSLVVAPSAIESGQARAVLQSHVADLVGRVRVPVLVVPSRHLDQR